MKKHLKILALAIMAVFLVAGNAMAFPYTVVSGSVNPYGATITDIGGGLSTVTGLEYTFNVTGSMYGAEMNGLSLEFENDVFVSVSSLTFLSPGDWIASPDFTFCGSVYKISSAGTFIGVGEYLQFAVDVTMYNDAFTNPSLWQEGQVWAQSWFSGDTLGGGDGGSTVHTPEPATVLLMGAGLGIFGLGALCRKKLGKA